MHLKSKAAFKYHLGCVGLNDPSAIVAWNTDRLVAAVANINAAMPALPGWVGVAYPITATQLQNAIMAHVNASAGAGGVANVSMISNNTVMQYGKIQTYFAFLGQDPLFAPVAAGNYPIANLYCGVDATRRNHAVADPVLVPPPPGKGIVQ